MTALLLRLTDGEQTICFQARGEWCYPHTPANYKNATDTGRGVPCVIQCHGNGGYVLYPENPVALSGLRG